MTFVELVNKVLIRLRENTVNSVSENPYSQLIGELVNATKREVEDSWNWSALHNTITAVTQAGSYSYILTHTGMRSRTIDVINDTTNYVLKRETTPKFNERFLITPLQTGEPKYYNYNGVSVEGDFQVDLFPVPDGEYEIRFNLFQPQADLVNDGDTILVPYHPIIEGTLARAIDERGDDGGSASQFLVYRNTLADYIAVDANNREEEITWVAN